MNAKVLLLVIGLVAGALVGYLTRPQAAELKLGPLQMEVQTDQTASPNDPVTSSQWQHIGIFTVIGAVIGLAAGFAVDRQRA